MEMKERKDQLLKNGLQTFANEIVLVLPLSTVLEDKQEISNIVHLFVSAERMNEHHKHQDGRRTYWLARIQTFVLVYENLTCVFYILWHATMKQLKLQGRARQPQLRQPATVRIKKIANPGFMMDFTRPAGCITALRPLLNYIIASSAGFFTWSKTVHDQRPLIYRGLRS